MESAQGSRLKLEGRLKAAPRRQGGLKPALYVLRHRPVGGQRFCRADYQRRELQRKMKNDEARPSPEAAREEFFPGV